MNPLIILSIIGMLITGAWAGISGAVYNSNGNANIPWLSFIPKFPIDFSSASVPTNTINSSLPIGEWVSSAPTNDIMNSIWNGTSGILNWLTNIMTSIVAWIIHLVAPSVVIPSYLGPIIFWLLTLLFIFLAWSRLESLIIKIITVALIIIFVVFTLIIILLLLHLI